VTEIMSKWEELNVYLPPTTDPTEIQKRSEQDLIFTYLGALDTSYESIRSQILASAEMPSFDDVVARIEQEQSRRALMNPRQLESQDNQAFQVHHSNSNPSFRDTAKGRGASSTVQCDHCKKAGHNRDGCWFLHPHLRPVREKGDRGGKWGGGKKEKRFGGFSKGTETDEGTSRDESAAQSNSLSGDPSGSSVAQTVQLNHLLTQLNNLLQQQNPGFVYSNNNFNSPKISSSSKVANACQNTNRWVLDSGATDHMTWNKNKLTNITQNKDPQHVIVANGNEVQIHGYGTTKFLTKDVKNILYLPEFNSNLLSISKITQELNCNVIFSPKTVIFQDRESGKKIGEGSLENGLYYLNENTNKCHMSLSLVDRDKLLHWRFGHPSDQILNKLFYYKLDSKNCDVCKFSKQSRLPFPLSINKSAKCFDLIHSDVWGPAPIDSYNHFKYFVTFIDDFSRTTWVFLLKGKDEVFLKFLEFYNFIENQYNANLKIFRSDNGTEYVNKNFIEFFKQKGILHQTTCINTPEQNGVSERKNRHLLEVTRSLLFQTNVPKSYWSDAVLTAAYLINRLPSV
jgi:Integrase core domain